MLVNCWLSVVLLLAGQHSPKLPSIEEIGVGMDQRAANYRNLRVRIQVQSQFRPEAPGGKQLTRPGAFYRATDTWLLASPDRSRQNSWMWRWERIVEAEGVKPLFHVAWDGSEGREFYRNDLGGEPSVGVLTPFSNGDGMATNQLRGLMFIGYAPHDLRPFKSTLDYFTTCQFAVLGRDRVFGEDAYLIEGTPYPPELKKTLPKEDLPDHISRYWVTGPPDYMLLRIDSHYRDTASLTVEVTKHGDCEGFRYPKAGEVHYFMVDESGKGAREDYRFQVTSFEIDPNLTERDFTFEWPSHTVINDARTNRAIVIPPAPDDVTEHDVEMRMIFGPVADVLKLLEFPKPGQRSWLLWLGLGALPMLAILCGLLLWRRRRLRARS